MRKLFTLVVIALALAAFGCEVEKTGEDTYEVEVPTDDAEAAVDEAAQKTETALEEAGEEIQEGAREAAKQTGEALEEAGKEIQEKSKPDDQEN